MAAKPKPGRYYHLFAKHSGKVLGTAGGHRGAPLQQQKLDPSLPATQQFEFISVNNNEFFIKPRLDKYLDVAGHSMANGALINIWDWNNNSANQRFQLLPGPDGYYYVRCVQSGKVFDVTAASDADGTQVAQYHQYLPPLNHQLFKLVMATSRSALADNRSFEAVNEDVRNALVGVVGGVPKVGGALKMILGALWPAVNQQQLFWNQMKDYVEQRIKVLVRESELNNMEIHMKGAVDNVMLIKNDTSTLPKGNAVEAVIHTIVSAHAAFLDHDRAEYDDPTQAHTSTAKSPLQIMPYLVGMGTILLSLMRQRVVNYDELYVKAGETVKPADRVQNVNSHLKALRGMMFRYLRAVILSREQGIKWRQSFITEVQSKERLTDRHDKVYSTVTDNYDGWKLYWQHSPAADNNEPGVDANNHRFLADSARARRLEQVRVQFGAEMDEYLNPARLWRFMDQQTAQPVATTTHVATVGPFGAGNGFIAIEPPANHGRLERLVVYSHHNGAVAGLDLRYAGSAAKLYGTRTDHQQELDLKANEHVASVSGTERAAIETLLFQTNMGRQAGGGSNPGTDLRAAAYWNADLPDSLRAKLHKITGSAHNHGISNITLHWAYDYSGVPLPTMEELPVPNVADMQALQALTQHLKQLA